MTTLVFTKSIDSIPPLSGTYWIKGQNCWGNFVTVYVSHSPNVYESIRVANKSGCYKEGLMNFRVEVLLDKDTWLAA